MSLQQLADITGLSKGYICYLGKETRVNPSFKTMKNIANALKKEASEVFGL